MPAGLLAARVPVSLLDHPWMLAGVALFAAALAGWIGRQGWRLPGRLRRAERLWAAGRPGREALAALGALAPLHGEIGYRAGILASQIHLALGDRKAAWRCSREAHQASLPFWRRSASVLLGFWLGERPGSRTLRWGVRLLPLAGEAAGLRLRLGRALLRSGDQAGERLGWSLLMSELPFAQEDPVLLEALMLDALAWIQGARTEKVQLGPQEWSPVVPYIFEQSLACLLTRHGDGRQGWDRVPAALHLLGEHRHHEVLRIIATVPESRRPRELCEAEAIALRAVGDLHGAWRAVERSLAAHPMSFRLWMERFHASMGRREPGAARESLEMARRLLPPDRARPEAGEWHLHRAEFAHWVEQDPALAWDHLAVLPEAARESNPRLHLQVLVALERFEEAHDRIAALLARRPEDGELLLLQAECMAGLEAWESLPPFLERLPQEAREHPTFWHLRGLAMAHLDDPQGARGDLEIAAHLAPRDIRMVLDAGHACMELGDHARAEQFWRRALQLDRTCEEALIQLADTRQARQDPEGARRILRECLLHHPESESAQVFLAELEAN